MEERNFEYRFLLGEPEGKRPFGRPRLKWDVNIKIDLQEVEWGLWSGLNWLTIGQKASSCECGNEHLVSIKCSKILNYLRTY
jgi:hypothetical protein